MTTDNQPKTSRDILTRYAAVVPVLVEAGCERPPEYLRIEDYIGKAALLWPERHDDHDLAEVHDYIRNDMAGIAVLEQWFSQTVVPWAEDDLDVNMETTYRDGTFWCFRIEIKRYKFDDPTEANIQCAEALAEVIGGKR